MADTKEELTLIDDPNIVEYRTDIKGWTGQDGKYYGHGDEGERRARYANATHKKCECGNIIEKTRGQCGACWDKKRRENFEKLEVIEWDGESMMCIYQDDTFFSDMDEVHEYCENNDVDIRDLELMHCERLTSLPPINIDELNEEYTDQNGEGVSHYHPEIAAKVEELNKMLENIEPKLWFGTNKRIKV